MSGRWLSPVVRNCWTTLAWSSQLVGQLLEQLVELERRQLEVERDNIAAL